MSVVGLVLVCALLGGTAEQPDEATLKNCTLQNSLLHFSAEGFNSTEQCKEETLEFVGMLPDLVGPPSASRPMAFQVEGPWTVVWKCEEK